MSPPSSTPASHARLLAVVPVALATVAYLPITRNFFFADDFYALYHLVNDGFTRFVLEPVAGHVLVVRNAIFYVSYQLFGPRPAAFFWVVLATHLLNVLLVFALVRDVTRSAHLACFGATLWGTSPVHEGALGWYAVYGQVVAASIILAVLRDMLRHADAVEGIRPRTVWRWCVLMLLASMCFGIAIGVALVFPAIAWLLVPGLAGRPALWRPLVALPFATLVLYAAFHLLWAEAYGESAADVWRLLGGPLAVATMLVHLVAAGMAGSVLGGAYAAATYPAPLALAALAVFGAALAIACVRADAPSRRRAAGLVLVALAGYLTIAAGRAEFFAALQRPMATAAAAFRYHYLTSAVLVVVACWVLAQLTTARVARWRNAALMTGLAAVVLSRRNVPPIDHHDLARRETQRILDTVRDAVAAAPPGSTVYVDNRPFVSIAIFVLPHPAMFPGWAAVFLIFRGGNELDGRTVQFVARNAAELEATRHGGPIASLLVAATARGARSAS